MPQKVKKNSATWCRTIVATCWLTSFSLIHISKNCRSSLAYTIVFFCFWKSYILLSNLNMSWNATFDSFRSETFCISTRHTRLVKHLLLNESSNKFRLIWCLIKHSFFSCAMWIIWLIFFQSSAISPYCMKCTEKPFHHKVSNILELNIENYCLKYLRIFN